jgi:DNA-binding winged helix-turn-helix (wHTH) protein/TolB-like protein/tetratricopeptide (TPR) repeat protein
VSSPETSAGAPLRGFRLGEWTVEPDLNRVTRNGRTVHLRPKVMDVLVCLAEHPGEVVSKESLIDTVWSKAFIGDSALAVAIFELRGVFSDSSRDPHVIETIPKRGYRLLGDVLPLDAKAPASEARSNRPRRHARRVIAVGAVLAAAVTVTALVALRATRQTDPAIGTAERTRIVVLPFENLGPADRAYFAAGITDEIAARLTGLRSLAVVSHAGAQRYAAGGSASTIGRELGVDYILSGTVRWQDEGSADGSATVRISPRLVRVADDTNVWAENYDRDSADVLGVQAEVARQVVARLGVTPLHGERAMLQSMPTTVPEAYEAYLQGNFYLRHRDGAEDQLLAVRMFERAIELDPGFALAYAALSTANATLYHYGFDRSAERREKAYAAAMRASTLAPGTVEAHLAFARYHHMVDLDHLRAGKELAAAARLRPDDLSIIVQQAVEVRRQGRFADAAKGLQRAVALDPSNPTLLYEMGVTHTVLGRYAQAQRDYERSIDLMPDQHTAYAWSAYNALLWQGSLAEAQGALARIPVPGRSEVVIARWTFALYARDFQGALEILAGLPQGVAAIQSYYLPRSLLMAETYRVMGYEQSSRELFGDARLTLEREAAKRPDDGRVSSALGLAYAGLGMRAESLTAAGQALKVWPRARDAVRFACCLEARARARLMLGDLDGAVSDLAELLAGPVPPYAFPILDLDPRWAPLRNHARYAELLAQRSPEAREKASL